MVFDDALPDLPEEVQKRILAIYVRDHVARHAATCTAARHLLSHDAPCSRLLHQKSVPFTLYVIFHSWWGVDELDYVTQRLWEMRHTARSLACMEDLLIILKGDVVDREATTEEKELLLSAMITAFTARYLKTKKQKTWRDKLKTTCFAFQAVVIVVAVISICLIHQIVVRL